MPTILAIDTSSDIASVALFHQGTIHTISQDGFSTHSMSILPMTQSLLTQNELAITDCDALAFGCGPGSFTGVRTTCGVVQGIAFGLEIPVIPIVTLEAMAESCRQKIQANHVISLLDARMHEVYWAEYAYQNGEWQTITAPQLSAASKVYTKNEVVFCGNGLTAYCDELKSIIGHSQKIPDIFPEASAMVRLAVKLFQTGKTISVDQIQPLYLRNHVALKTVERMALKEKHHVS